MAKRKRLSPTPGGIFGAESPNLETKSALAPIAQVGADAATRAALEDVSQELSQARAEGRLIQSLTLACIDKAYLMRDRIAVDDDEMETLAASLKARGQQTPIEVVQTAPDHYGLISGWRRVTALERLGATEVLALVRAPGSASEAYIAMVEENEIRVDLSYYERARIVAKSLEQGIFPDRYTALNALFGAASKAKRSKIGGFLPLVDALDGVLQFPTAIPERVGLPLARAIEAEPALGRLLAERLRDDSSETPQAELSALMAVWKPRSPAPSEPKTTREEIRTGVFLEVTGGFTKPVITLSGPKVDPGFRNRLEDWLRGR